MKVRYVIVGFILAMLLALVVFNQPVDEREKLHDRTFARSGEAVARTLAPPTEGFAVQEKPSVSQSDGASTRQVVRLAISRGEISLVSSQIMRGDFGSRRGPPLWRPGLWCVRVVDAEGRALAQETLLAPDEPCVVLDPHVSEGNSGPRAVTYRDPAAEALVQVRLPVVSQGRALKIYRLNGFVPAPLTAEPQGTLLAHLPFSS